MYRDRVTSSDKISGSNPVDLLNPTGNKWHVVTLDWWPTLHITTLDLWAPSRIDRTGMPGSICCPASDAPMNSLEGQLHSTRILSLPCSRITFRSSVFYKWQILWVQNFQVESQESLRASKPNNSQEGLLKLNIKCSLLWFWWSAALQAPHQVSPEGLELSFWREADIRKPMTGTSTDDWGRNESLMALVSQGQPVPPQALSAL